MAISGRNPTVIDFDLESLFSGLLLTYAFSCMLLLYVLWGVVILVHSATRALVRILRPLLRR